MSLITFIHKASLDCSNELKTSKKTLRPRAQREQRRVSKETKLSSRQAILFDVKSISKLKNENKTLLVLGILFTPLIIPSIILYVRLMFNENKLAYLEKQVGNNQTPRGNLDNLFVDGLVVDSDKDYQKGLSNLKADLSRDLRLNDQNIPEMVLSLIGDIKSNNDIPALVQKLKRKAPKASELDKAIMSETIKFLEKNKEISSEGTLLTGKELIQEIKEKVTLQILSLDNIEKFIKLMMPEVKDITNLVKFYSQHPAYIPARMVGTDEFGFNTLCNKNTTNIKVDKDGSIKMILKNEQYTTLDMNNMSKYKLKDASIQTELLLTDRGFELQNVKFSHDKMAKLAFAKTPKEVAKALSGMAIKIADEVIY